MEGNQKPLSNAALRQKRYRERCSLRNAGVTESVTERNENVTKRNALRHCDSSTISMSDRNALRSPSLSYLESNKERKKERGIQGVTRNALPENWTPSLEAISLATARKVNVVDVAAKFRLSLKASGKTYSDYDAAFMKWIYNERPVDGESEVYMEPQRNYMPTEAEFNRAAANFAKNNSFWGKAMGPEPGMLGCKCPPEILLKHGIDPKTGLTK